MNRRLRSVCLLIDGKVGVKKHDLVAFEMLEEFGAPFQVVFKLLSRDGRLLYRGSLGWK